MGTETWAPRINVTTSTSCHTSSAPESKISILPPPALGPSRGLMVVCCELIGKCHHPKQKYCLYRCLPRQLFTFQHHSDRALSIPQSQDVIPRSRSPFELWSTPWPPQTTQLVWFPKPVKANWILSISLVDEPWTSFVLCMHVLQSRSPVRRASLIAWVSPIFLYSVRGAEVLVMLRGLGDWVVSCSPKEKNDRKRRRSPWDGALPSFLLLLLFFSIHPSFFANRESTATNLG